MTAVAAGAAPVAADVIAFLQRFLDSPDGELAARLAEEHDSAATVEIRLVDPDAVVHLDLAGRIAADGPADAPAATVTIVARDLNDLLLDRLGPVEISRLIEEERLHLEGPPPALAALLLLAGSLQAHYPASLRERMRDELLNAPAPPVGEVWESGTAPPPVFGKRRPWQRPRGARADD